MGLATHRLRKPVVACLVGLIHLGLLGPGLAAPVRNLSSSAAVEANDPDQLVKELAQLEAQIAARARAVSLDEAISKGLEANPQLLQTFSAIQQYEWQLIAAQRQWYPTLQLTNGTPFAGVQWTAFVQNYPTSSTAAPAYNSTSQQSAFQPGAAISWNAIDPTRQPNINAASKSLSQQKLLFNVSARNLVLQIQQAYFEVQSTQQLIDSFRRIYAINKLQLSTVEAQKTIGMATVLDVEASRSQLFLQLNQLVSYTRDLIDQTANLAAVMALPEGSLAIPSQTAALWGDWTQSEQQTIQEARRNREEILASLAAAEAAQWSAVAAIRSYIPVIQLVANATSISNSGMQTYSYGGAPSSQTPTTIINNTSSIGLGFTWSIFDGGIQAANAQAAKAQARQQNAQAASTELEVMQQVRSSYGQLKTSRIALTSAKQAYRSAELAQQASRARFSVGVGDITSVVQNIQQLSQAAIQVSEAILSYNNALAQLYRYSATWPPQSLEKVEQRLKSLRVGPAPASPAAKP